MDKSRRNFLKSTMCGAAVVAATTILPSPVMAGVTKEEKKRIPRTHRVLIIGLDGIRVDGFKQAHTPNLDRLLAEGALSTSTRVVMPSNTQPNWMSHLSGSGPEVHGVDRNDWRLDNHVLEPVVADEDGYYPTVFKVLKDNVEGVNTAFYYNWAELINPYNKKYLDEVSFEENDGYTGNYAKALDFMTRHRDEPTMVFLYTVHTDHAGHRHTWMSPEYIASIEEADVEIGKLLDEMKKAGIYDDTHILFISDHGGTGYGHGGMSPEEMIVPWGIKGPGIAKRTISEPNNTVNTAPVILALFGVEPPLCWTGEIPTSIFE